MDNLKFQMSAIEDHRSDEYWKLQNQLMFVINKLINFSENKLTKLDQDKTDEIERLESLKLFKANSLLGVGETDDLDE